MSRTVKVKVAVAVDRNGRWVAHGWEYEADATAMQCARNAVGWAPACYWLEAEVAVPEATTVAAQVSDA